ncbi:Sec-independent protein translocase protein TatB [Candidatus Puniceispirillum marinum]|uniref:Twin-arginine translocation protein, TatB subunit n=1 Tax=Puniceispirillum marinum (strain IMCC1322) TaxID=488538 RepID=D5BQU3_PUNMI|nr:Sec-independent protein translocase protein TatB [Candidatus Puniceispirillum marinum]ADE38657.1 twin-arginine translocation protein, TatB subunit [Candidatus Puniceispirillum marinum IMCC1322]
MLDIGGWEFLVVAFVLLMVVGPKELPKMLRGFTRFTRQMRAMASEFTRGMEDIASQSEVSDLKNTIADIKQGDYSNLVDTIDPSGDLADTVDETKRSIAGNTDLEEVKSLVGDAKAMIGDDLQQAGTKSPAAKKTTPKKTVVKKPAPKKTTRPSATKKSKKSAG